MEEKGGDSSQPSEHKLPMFPVISPSIQASPPKPLQLNTHQKIGRLHPLPLWATMSLNTTWAFTLPLFSSALLMMFYETCWEDLLPPTLMIS